MKVWAQIVGLDTGDASPAVLIVTDTSRYLVNVGEGLQRFCAEHRTRLVKLDGIFLTQLTQPAAGGLAGMILTLADMGRKQLRLFGGPGLVDYLFATRHFMRRSDVVLEAREFGAGRGGEPAPPVHLPDLSVTPILSTCASETAGSGLAAVDDALTSLYLVNGDLAPFGGADPASMLGAEAPPVVLDAETPTARNSEAPAITPSRPGSTGISNRALRDAAARKEMTGLPLPLPFNPLLATLHEDRQAGEVEAVAHLTALLSLSPTTPPKHAAALPSLLWRPLMRGPGAAPLATAYAARTAGIGSRGVTTAMSYLFTTAPVGGRFHPDKARALGLKAGPDFGKLSRGESVWVGDVEVRPEHVKDRDTPGQAFAVASCPATGYLPSLVSHPAWAPFLTPAPASPLRVLYHTAPPHVVSSAPYGAWMAAFGPSTRHVMLHPGAAAGARASVGAIAPVEGSKEWEGAPFASAGVQPVVFAAQAAQACRMHLLEPTLFPLPYPLGDLARAAAGSPAGGLSPLQSIAARLLADPNALAALGADMPPPSPPSDPQPGSSTAEKGGEGGLPSGRGPIAIEAGRILAAHHLLPLALAGSDASATHAPWNPTHALHPALIDASITPLLRAALGAAERGEGCVPPPSAPSPPPGALLLFTGTASAVPSKYRNVSGMLLRTEAGAGVILDCGEGTYGQLARLLGRGEQAAPTLPGGGSVEYTLAQVRIIWVSHLHADHHLGALRLISERRAARASTGLPALPVLLIGPSKLLIWMLEASRVDAELRGKGSWLFADAEHFLHVPLHSFRPDLGIAPLPECDWEGDDGGMEEEEAALVPSPPAEVSPSPKRARRGEEVAAVAPAPGPYVQRWTPPGEEEEVLLPVPVPVLVPSQTLVIPLPYEGEGASPPNDGPSTNYLATPSFINSVLREARITAFRTMHVRHCHKAYGLRIELLGEGGTAAGEDGAPWPWSLVYSGDTRPCRELVALGAGSVASKYRGARQNAGPYAYPLEVAEGEARADSGMASWVSSSSPSFTSAARTLSSLPAGLLVHEATFDDTAHGRGNALEKRHSTVDEACAVAGAMRAGHTILTHFSARYPKLPVLKVAEAGAGRGTVAVAYDLCAVHGRDITRLSLMLPALHTLFAEAEEGDGEEAAGL
jgi:ribonuclease BN (tRNA processing enzyme)